MFEHFGNQLVELFWEVVEMCLCVLGRGRGEGLATGSDCQMVGLQSYSQLCLQPRLSLLHDVMSCNKLYCNIFLSWMVYHAFPTMGKYGTIFLLNQEPNINLSS